MVELGQDQLIARLEREGCREIVQQLGGRDADANLRSVSNCSSIMISSVPLPAWHG